MNLLLFREAYLEEMRGGGRWLGWRRGKSDRLDYESTHRRTLFNVSLTFLLSISSPPTLSHWKRMGREEKPGERERKKRTDESLGGDSTLCLHFTQGHKPQTKSRVRVHGRASQSGGGQMWVRSGFSAQESPWWFCPDPGWLVGSSCASQSFPFIAFLSFW